MAGYMTYVNEEKKFWSTRSNEHQKLILLPTNDNKFENLNKHNFVRSDFAFCSYTIDRYCSQIQIQVRDGGDEG